MLLTPLKHISLRIHYPWMAKNLQGLPMKSKSLFNPCCVHSLQLANFAPPFDEQNFLGRGLVYGYVESEQTKT